MGALEGVEEGVGEALLQLVETWEVVGELGSQLLVVEVVVEGQQNQGEVEKMGVKAVGGFLEIQIPQLVVEVGSPVEVEAAELVVKQIQVWDLVESSEEELGVDGLG